MTKGHYAIMKKTIICLVLWGIGLPGCKPLETRLAGCYEQASHREGSPSLRLYASHRFHYYAYQSPVFIGTFGKWQVEGKNLVLNSDTALKTLPPVMFADVPAADSVKIRLYGWGDGHTHIIGSVSRDPIAGAKVHVKTPDGWIQVETDDRGRAKMATAYIDSIRVTAPGMKPLNEALRRNPAWGELLIGMEKEQAKRLFFTDEKWEIRRNRLFRLTPERATYRKCNKKGCCRHYSE